MTGSRTSTRRIADLALAPARSVKHTAGGTVRVLREWSSEAVDDWGRDPDAVRRAFAVSRLRWDVAVGGTQHLPTRSGALIVVNARRWALAPVFAALAIGEAIDRPVRFVGRPDIAPLGPLLQRLGALLPVDHELEGALRAGELIVLGSGPTTSNARAGTVDHLLVGAAVRARVKILPAATLSTTTRRAARVEIAAPLRPTRIRRGPLAELELSDAAAAKLDALLDEIGGSLSGPDLGWWTPLAQLLGGAT